MGQLYVPKDLPRSSYWINFKWVSIIFSKHSRPHESASRLGPLPVEKQVPNTHGQEACVTLKIQPVPFTLREKENKMCKLFMFHH